MAEEALFRQVLGALAGSRPAGPGRLNGSVSGQTSFDLPRRVPGICRPCLKTARIRSGPIVLGRRPPTPDRHLPRRRPRTARTIDLRRHRGHALSYNSCRSARAQLRHGLARLHRLRQPASVSAHRRATSAAVKWPVRHARSRRASAFSLCRRCRRGSRHARSWAAAPLRIRAPMRSVRRRDTADNCTARCSSSEGSPTGRKWNRS